MILQQKDIVRLPVIRPEPGQKSFGLSHRLQRKKPLGQNYSQSQVAMARKMMEHK